MGKKIMAIAAVAIIVVAAVGIYYLAGDKNESDDYMNIIGWVNTDGSGIFLKEGTTEEFAEIVHTQPSSDKYYLGGNGTWVVFDKAVWGGKVFGTPGAATIQHVQLNQIVSLMGLNFVQYVQGQETKDDTVYYIPGVNNYDKFVSTLNSTPAMVGAFMWEPQYSVALKDGCVSLATTNDMFPGHTCCTIGAQHGYITTHEDETVRFLAAYIESVNQMVSAIEAGSGDAYDKVLEVALEKVNMPASMTKDEKIDAIESAFDLVVYTYKDVDASAADPLASLKADIADLAVEFKNNGQVKNSYSDLGFSTPEALANSFVNSDYIKKAEAYEVTDDVKVTKITVAVIAGDIHQLAIHYGMAEGVDIFDKYGIDITLSSQAGGPAVYTAMANGDAQFGFIGAPPMTINSMNSGSIEPVKA